MTGPIKFEKEILTMLVETFNGSIVGLSKISKQMRKSDSTFHTSKITSSLHELQSMKYIHISKTKKYERGKSKCIDLTEKGYKRYKKLRRKKNE